MKNKPIQYKVPDEQLLPRLLQEPEVAYTAGTLSFSTAAFIQLSRQLGFSQAEWGIILNISDRTIQRSLKDDKSFTGLQAELLHYLKKLTETGLQLFENEASFVAWLRTPKNVLGQPLGFESLQSITGIRLLQQELGRIAYGVYI
ncbi:MAG TPA: antitoxin Xre-like helix-turn-helix domain-containing protein [Phnomibacter sp.]|nr:antitoxin Xre-like helix-turn-helix domain-containing protein [Phnomibacter sp.]